MTSAPAVRLRLKGDGAHYARHTLARTRDMDEEMRQIFHSSYCCAKSEAAQYCIATRILVVHSNMILERILRIYLVPLRLLPDCNDRLYIDEVLDPPV